MQEVFKKIIDKLKAEQNKADEKCKDIVVMDGHSLEYEFYNGKSIECKHAIEIVNQVAAEYNNGWILCSVLMPEEPEEGLTDLDECDEYIVMIEDADIPTALNYVGNGEWYRDGNYYKVIAWQPLPEPYQHKS